MSVVAATVVTAAPNPKANASPSAWNSRIAFRQEAGVANHEAALNSSASNAHTVWPSTGGVIASVVWVFTGLP